MAKASKNRGLSVTLLSSHPLVLDEFQRLLARSGFPLKAKRLESTLTSELRQLSVPRARVYVVDALGPRLSTQALVSRILEVHSAARLLVVAEKLNEASSFPLLRQGVKGLLDYAQAREQLPRALEAVAKGGYWVPRALLQRFVENILDSSGGKRRAATAPSDLSPRERQVLDALLENLSNKEIAGKLYISERTAKFHVSNLLAKFNVRRRADLIMLHFQDRQLRS